MGQPRRTADRKAAPKLLTNRHSHPSEPVAKAHRSGKPLPPSRERTLLLTGFEPFRGERRNPSLEVARSLDGELIGDFRVKAVALPVVYGGAARRIVDLITRIRPAAVLGLGQAGGRPVITLERVAINLLDGPAPDNAGRRLLDKPVIRGGPDAYFARLPLRQILRSLERGKTPATLSLSAGSFICNAVMYAALHELRTRPAVPCGFIHLPYDTRQAMRHRNLPSMSIDLMVGAIRIAIAAIVNSRGRRR